MNLQLLFKSPQGSDVFMHVQDRDAEEGDEQWSLSRFAPLMQEVLEDLASNKLNMDEYPYVQPPTNETGQHLILAFREMQSWQVAMQAGLQACWVTRHPLTISV